jgi:hypothetical protein
VPANIHAVAFVLDGARYAANLAAALKNDGLDLGPAQELERGGQTGRSRASIFPGMLRSGESGLPYDNHTTQRGERRGDGGFAYNDSISDSARMRCLSGAEDSGRNRLGIDLWRTKLLLKLERP